MSNIHNYIHPGSLVKGMPPNAIRSIKVMFINMPVRENAIPNCLPYGVCLLAATLRRWGAEPSIIDLNAHRDLTCNMVETLILRGLIKHGEPVVVALSGIITTLGWQEKVSKIIRKYVPDVFLVSGNGLATEFKSGLFNWIPELDGVADSEGDDSIVKIVYDATNINRLGFGKSLDYGLLEPYHAGEKDGRHRFLYSGGRPSDLDNLPLPAYDLLEEHIRETYIKNPVWGLAAQNSSATPFQMTRSINTISSRGCPFSCNFCFRGSTGERNYGVRSAESFQTEMRTMKTMYNLDFIGILDDNFMVQKQRVIDFSKLMKPVNIRWGVHGRMDEAQDERVHAMADGGCVYIGFGGESASAMTLSSMDKGGFTLTNGVEKVDDYEFPVTYMNAIKNTHKAGVHANVTWMMAYPRETLKELQTTVAFIRWQEGIYGDKESVNKKLFVATAYPGTAMFSDPKVKDVMASNFGISYNPDQSPVCDDNMRDYVLSLGDATQVIIGKTGKPINFSNMPDDTFLEAKQHIEQDNLYKILEMKY